MKKFTDEQLAQIRLGWRWAALRGSSNDRAKLTDAGVTEMRRLWREGKATIRELAAIHRVGKTTIWYAVNRKTWRHLP